ncbi:MAG: DUF3604 domain-containing protein [Deltaproteobacteria bacterium]|nr:DUF3604 domain-containing protein [Deltaproteobacteria bacterium]MBW2361020.1 DUF3604 domain-containing protein [Deltaproteobacteria bacterium]
MRKVSIAVLGALLLALGCVYVVGMGWLGTRVDGGTPTRAELPAADVLARKARQDAATLHLAGGAEKQILFGDLHVHTGYSGDAFLVGLPITGGSGTRSVSDACDFARFCSGLDFWSINDHAGYLTPRRWSETKAAIRQCNEVAGDAANPDVVAFLGWEWTQMGTTPENHYGHKNVVLRDLDDERIPLRPIAADSPAAYFGTPSPMLLGLLAAVGRDAAYFDFAKHQMETADAPRCSDDVPVRELPEACREYAATPGELFAKLDDWGHEALVIPHGTTWGMYTPPGSSYDKQIAPGEHDPQRQRLVEVYSGHGNTEEYRAWRGVEFEADGSARCPEPSEHYVPQCWRAGEIIRERCTAAGASEELCAVRERDARRLFLEAEGAVGHLSVPGATALDWRDAGQCQDCFLPAFGYRPRNSVQYMLSLRQPEAPAAAQRFRFGFIGSSDTHTTRPGTGYKEVARDEMSDVRIALSAEALVGVAAPEAPAAEARAVVRGDYQPSRWLDSERAGSFFSTGGLVALHSPGRDRDAIFAALSRRETYGTSGPRILLWFDLLNGDASGQALPMGSAVAMSASPRFEVRAAGSLVQRSGCPASASGALEPEQLEWLCSGECYNPSEIRRRISRIEVVRIRPRRSLDEPVAGLIDDPWRVLPCPSGGDGCRVRFEDPEFARAGRDAVYYVRAIEDPSPGINGDGLRCQRDAEGACIAPRACDVANPQDDCLAPIEQRAWSSPIFVDSDA